jgi:hypothetical protein
VTRKEILALFPGTDLGEVERALADAMKQLDLRGDDLPHDQALAVLNGMTATPGVVGVAARFAKVRALLLPKKPTGPKR